MGWDDDGLVMAIWGVDRGWSPLIWLLGCEQWMVAIDLVLWMWVVDGIC